MFCVLVSLHQQQRSRGKERRRQRPWFVVCSFSCHSISFHSLLIVSVFQTAMTTSAAFRSSLLHFFPSSFFHFSFPVCSCADLCRLVVCMVGVAASFVCCWCGADLHRVCSRVCHLRHFGDDDAATSQQTVKQRVIVRMRESSTLFCSFCFALFLFRFGTKSVSKKQNRDQTPLEIRTIRAPKATTHAEEFASHVIAVACSSTCARLTNAASW